MVSAHMQRDAYRVDFNKHEIWTCSCSSRTWALRILELEDNPEGTRGLEHSRQMSVCSTPNRLQGKVTATSLWHSMQDSPSIVQQL